MSLEVTWRDGVTKFKSLNLIQKMKKLNLKDLAFQKGEVLTRSQLKNVLGGGSGSPLGSGSPVCPSS
ncbi:hypothetical protein, partial [Pedobacter sp. B4-66]